MKPADVLQTATTNMFRSRVRTVLTIVAVFIGATTITLTNGIGSGVKDYLAEQIGGLGATNVLFVTVTSPNTSPNSGPVKYKANDVTTSSGVGRQQSMLTSNDLDRIKAAIPEIVTLVPAHSPAPDYIMGIGDKYMVAVVQAFGVGTVAMVSGRTVDTGSPRNEITVPETYVQPLGYDDKSIVGKTVTIGITSAEGVQSTITATITGVQQKNLIAGSGCWVNTALADQLTAIQDDGIPASLANTWQTAFATLPSNLTTAQVDAIKHHLNALGYTGQTIQDAQSTVFTTVNTIILAFNVFGFIALLAAAFGIINTLYMSVQERTKEIGLMRALGMSPRNVFLMFSAEAVLIGFWGSAFGVAFAVVIGAVVNGVGTNGFLKDYPGLSLLTFPLVTIAAVIGGIMLIAFAAGTLPALRASRKDPIQALRYE